MSDNILDRIADEDEKHYQMLATDGGWLCACGHRFTGDTYREWRLHKADAVIKALGPMPERSFMDDQGRTWEWCGGKPGTWAWRITDLGIAHD